MSGSAYRPVSPDRLADYLARTLIERHPGERPLRVGLDAPEAAGFGAVIEGLVERLRAAGRPVALIRAVDFYRDASLRFEFGKTDLESFYAGWLDVGALQREVLAPLAAEGRYLPSLRDPVSNRSTRAEPAELAGAGIALVSGQLLLGTGLEFDLTVHVVLSRPALRRRTEPALAWTLPAFDRYDLDVDPAGLADLIVRFDDPAHPALLDRARHA